MLFGYNIAKSLELDAPDLLTAGVHFFIDDYRFEVVWNRPHKTLPPFQRFNITFTPDWSLYIDYPLAVQIWNTYRNRWCGAWWQKNGVQGVVPSVGWSDERSYDFAFCGIEKGSPVAISTLGIREKEFWISGNWDRFRQGYEEMIRRIEPGMVFCYGPLPEWALDMCPVRAYPTTWDLKKPTKRMLTIGKDLYIMPPEHMMPKRVVPKPARKPAEREAARAERKLARLNKYNEAGITGYGGLVAPAKQSDDDFDDYISPVFAEKTEKTQIIEKVPRPQPVVVARSKELPPAPASTPVKVNINFNLARLGGQRPLEDLIPVGAGPAISKPRPKKNVGSEGQNQFLFDFD